VIRWTTVLVSCSLSACIQQQSASTLLQPIAPENLLNNCTLETAIATETEDLAATLNPSSRRCFSLRETVRKTVGSALVLIEHRLVGNTTLLVFNATGDPFTLSAKQSTNEVLVVGEVRPLNIAEFERDYGLELDATLYAEYENIPAMMAQSIFLAPEPGEVTKNPAAFDDQVIVVAGEIDDRFTLQIFTLDEEQFIGGEDLLVIVTTTVPEFEEEDEDVWAVGILRRFDADAFDQEYELDWNIEIQRKLQEKFGNKPVLVAEAVYLDPD
jgi:hypothetical protein